MRMNTMNSGCTQFEEQIEEKKRNDQEHGDLAASKLKAEAIIKGAQLEERTVESEADHEQEESSEVFGKKKAARRTPTEGRTGGREDAARKNEEQPEEEEPRAGGEHIEVLLKQEQKGSWRKTNARSNY
ncbi:hypothetical protein EJB05_40163, partial [Eragrostis curvula]